MADAKKIAERVMSRRIEMGYSQTRLAKLVGMSQACVNKIESGLTKSPKYIEQLAKVLKCCPAWLMFGVGRKPKRIRHCETCNCFNLTNGEAT